MTRIKSQRELEQMQKNLEYRKDKLKVFIADIISPENIEKENIKERMIELENLVNTYGGIVIIKHIQNKALPDYNTYVGKGKLNQIIEEMKEQEANLLIIGNILKPKQIYNIDEKLKPIGAKAWDRIDLILKIFEKNAKTKESELQIELASIKHMGPRIFGMGEELGNQGRGGSKLSRGKGETNTEIMKRHLEERERNIRKELKQFEVRRSGHRQTRAKKGMSTVGVVGYTNAGKSTLTNALTKKGVLAEDKLFATLGTSVGKMFVAPLYNEQTGEYKKGKEVLINDTIGFIRDLPPELIEAFKSTLEDSIESDILLHVIDAGDNDIDNKINVVEEILNNIGAKQKRIYVFNKIDKLNAGKFLIEENGEKTSYKNKKIYLEKKYSYLSPIFISAEKKENIEGLKNQILKELSN